MRLFKCLNSKTCFANIGFSYLKCLDLGLLDHKYNFWPDSNKLARQAKRSRDAPPQTSPTMLALRLEMSTYTTRVVFDGIAENVFSVSQPVSYAQDFVFAWFEKCLKDIYVDKKCVLGCVSKGS